MIADKKTLTDVAKPERLPSHDFGTKGATVRLMALSGNSGVIYIMDEPGKSNARETLWEIAAGGTTLVHVNDLDEIYALPAVANDIIQWSVQTK